MDVTLYVYYCVDADKSRQARKAVDSIFKEVEQKTQVRGRMLCKMEDANTWLEVYGPAKDVDLLAQTVEDAAFESGIKHCLQTGTARHVERFMLADDMEPSER